MSQDLLEEYIETGNSKDLTDLLIANPGLAMQKTSHLVSPLMLCCYFKKPDLADIFAKYVQEINIFEASALGRSDLLEKTLISDPSLLHEFSEDGFTPLGLASYFGHEDVVRFLLLKGADPNIHSRNGFNVYPIHSAVSSDYNMVSKMLIEAGADVNVVQMSGVTPLHSAAHNGNIDLIIVLLEAGANVSSKTEEGKTPADKALEEGFIEIARILN